MKKIIAILLSVLMIIGATVVSYAVTPADGTYSVSVSMTGGTGKARITSATLTVSGGQMKAKVVWSSENYTFMRVNGTQYWNENSGGKATFTIPVSALDTPLDMSAETAAMSEPHEIDYKITFSSSGVTMKDATQGQTGSSGSNQTAGGSVSSNAPDNNADEPEEEPEEMQETADTDVIAVENPYSKSTSISAEILAGYVGKTMKLSTVRGIVSFDEEATSAIAQRAVGSVTLTMEDVTEEYKEQGYDLAVDLTLTDEEDNALYTQGDEGVATVTLNYDKDIEDGDTVKVYRVDGGEKEEIKAEYDADAKTVSFKTGHFSVYAVAQEGQQSSTVIIIAIAAVAVIAAATAAVIISKKKKQKM